MAERECFTLFPSIVLHPVVVTTFPAFKQKKLIQDKDRLGEQMSPYNSFDVFYTG